MTIDPLTLAAAFDEFAQAAQRLAAALRSEAKRTPLPETPNRVAAAPAKLRESKPSRLPAIEETAGDNKMRRAILIALAQFGRPMAIAQIGIYSGKAHKGGAFAKAMAGLRDDECVEGPGSGNKITQKGFAELGDWARLPEGSALFEFWCSKLGSMEEQILRAVRRSHVPMSRAAIGEATEKSHTGGAFAKAMARLRKMELVGGSGEAVVLSPILRRAIEPTIGVYDKSSGNSVRVDARSGQAR